MDWISLRNKAAETVKKYKYVVLILAVGVLLMALPESGDEAEAPEATEAAQITMSTPEQLEQILAQIDGVGKVKVMLTEASGAETIYQTDEDSSASGESQSVRVETVIVSDADRNEQGLVRQVKPPTWLGAIVVCQGAGSPAVQLSVAEAVANVTGISYDRITVLKMK